VAEAAERLGDKRLEEAFAAVVLFSEPLQFRMSDVMEAAQEDYPDLIRPETGGMGKVINDALGDPLHDTAEKVPLALMSLEGSDGEAVRVHIFSMTGGRYPEDHTGAIRRAIAFPEAQKAWDQHQAYLYISVHSKGTSLVDRFRAAQLTSAVASLFAGDPTALAVIFVTGDVFCEPGAFCKGARQAADGSWPLEQWISFQLTRDMIGDVPYIGCRSWGMAAFNGHELHFAPAPVDLSTAHSLCRAPAFMLLEAGSQFHDSDTMGLEGTDQKIRIRLQPEGPEVRTDTWVLIHPQSSMDERAVFGERTREPAPPGVDNTAPRPKPGFFQRMLGKKTH